MEDMISPIILMLVVGGVAGYFAGQIVKRISAMAVTIGVFAFILIALAFSGFLDINIEAITTNITSILGFLAPLGILAAISSVPFVASFVAGLFVGYRRY